MPQFAANVVVKVNFFTWAKILSFLQATQHPWCYQFSTMHGGKVAATRVQELLTMADQARNNVRG